MEQTDGPGRPPQARDARTTTLLPWVFCISFMTAASAHGEWDRPSGAITQDKYPDDPAPPQVDWVAYTQKIRGPDFRSHGHLPRLRRSGAVRVAPRSTHPPPVVHGRPLRAVRWPRPDSSRVVQEAINRRSGVMGIAGAPQSIPHDENFALGESWSQRAGLREYFARRAYPPGEGRLSTGIRGRRRRHGGPDRRLPLDRGRRHHRRTDVTHPLGRPRPARAPTPSEACNNRGSSWSGNRP